MLGRTANGLYWMNRQIERAENMARLVDTGLHLVSSRANGGDEWLSVLTSAGAEKAYAELHNEDDREKIIDFLLRDRRNPSSVLSTIEQARNNGRMVRTALTRDTWEALNETWMKLNDMLRRPVGQGDLPDVLRAIKHETAHVRGAAMGTMLRNENYIFMKLGTHIERADNTARILDVKYYVLLPSAKWVGSSLDTIQWESILRSVSAHRAFRWAYDSAYNASDIADFLILNRKMPRSLAYCYQIIGESLAELEDVYGSRHSCHDQAERIRSGFSVGSIQDIFDRGLHEFLSAFIEDNNRVSMEIAEAYRFD